MAQLASVLAWGASGRVFKSHCSDKPSEKATFQTAFFSEKKLQKNFVIIKKVSTFVPS